MQNKANFRKSQMNVSPVITREYKNNSNWTLGENKPNSKPIKANLLNAQINVCAVLTRDYENKSNWAICENKANIKPKQSQTKPIYEKAKMNVTSIITKGYENKPRFRAKTEQTQYKPNLSRRSLWRSRIKPNFKRGHLLIDRMNRICCVCGLTVSFDSAKMAQYTDNWKLVPVQAGIEKRRQKNLNLLKCKRLNSLSRLRPLTGTLFAYSNSRNFLYTDDKQ
jgi:hypothetical protein